MQTKTWDVLGIGNAAVDEMIYLDHFPRADSKMPAREVRRQGGGLVATALVGAARLGARAAFCSLLGEDELSLFTLADLQGEGVDCSACPRSPEGYPYHAYILVERETGTRTILYQHGSVEPPLETITPELVSAARVLLIDHHAPLACVRAAQLARERGIPVVADLENDRVPHFEALLAAPDHLLLGFNFAARLTGERTPEAILRGLKAGERACTAVTAGAEGVWFVLAGGEVQHLPAYPVEVVDTTGCGDVFHGVYAAGLAWGASAAESMRIASGAGAYKACHAGREGIPTRGQLDQFLREQDGRGILAAH